MDDDKLFNELTDKIKDKIRDFFKQHVIEIKKFFLILFYYQLIIKFYSFLYNKRMKIKK